MRIHTLAVMAIVLMCCALSAPESGDLEIAEQHRESTEQFEELLGGAGAGRSLLKSLAKRCRSTSCQRNPCYNSCKRCGKCVQCQNRWNVGKKSNGNRQWSVSLNGQSQGHITDDCCYKQANCHLSNGKSLYCDGNRCSPGDGRWYTAILNVGYRRIDLSGPV